MDTFNSQVKNTLPCNCTICGLWQHFFFFWWLIIGSHLVGWSRDAGDRWKWTSSPSTSVGGFSKAMGITHWRWWGEGGPVGHTHFSIKRGFTWTGGRRAGLQGSWAGSKFPFSMPKLWAKVQFTMTIIQEQQAYGVDALGPSFPRTVTRVEPTLTSCQPCNFLMTTA